MKMISADDLRARTKAAKQKEEDDYARELINEQQRLEEAKIEAVKRADKDWPIVLNNAAKVAEQGESEYTQYENGINGDPLRAPEKLYIAEIERLAVAAGFLIEWESHKYNYSYDDREQYTSHYYTLKW